jgi:glycosyltransferase involved in cell wall biosynthesis
MNSPKISIVTPSYNHARYIEWTVRSVVLQRYPNLEYVVMDGGSRDGTVGILEKYADYFTHWQSAPDGGQAEAVRNGFEHTCGDIMAYLNSDDMLAPGTLYWVADFFERNPGVDAVYSHRCTVDANNRVIWHWHLPPHVDYLMSRWDLIPQETCFWRRRIYEKVGRVDSSFRFALDYDLFTRFMLHGRMFRADRFLGAFRQHADSKTSTQLGDIGASEIQRIWQQYKVRCHKWDPSVAATFWRAVEISSHVFAATRKERPGVLPGVGYDYDEVWAGELNDPRIPPAHSKPGPAAP